MDTKTVYPTQTVCGAGRGGGGGGIKIVWRLSSGTFEETEVNSKYYIFLLFTSGKFVIEIYILFAQEAEIRIHKNGELD